MPTDLEQSIFRTTAWFSLFSCPLTAFELWKWLYAPARGYGLGEVYTALARSEWLQDKLMGEEGFYALRGETLIAELVRRRRERFVDAQRKFRVLKRAARWFQLLPSVRAVGAVNSLAWWATSERSDIDLYIITRPGRIWSSRFWLVLPFALLGRRPGSPVARDPLCFSFFSDVETIQLESVCLSRDPYMAFWVKSIVPVLDRDGLFGQIDHVNRWAGRVLPNVRPRAHHHRHRPGWLPALPMQPRFVEPLLRVLQRRRLPASLREIANTDTRVIVRDDMLKFHDNDRRAEFRDRFEALMAAHL